MIYGFCQELNGRFAQSRNIVFGSGNIRRQPCGGTRRRPTFATTLFLFMPESHSARRASRARRRHPPGAPTARGPTGDKRHDTSDQQREAPNFVANTTQGQIDFHSWIGDSWTILFSHPKDFTPVCTTELGYMAGLKPEFDKRNTKIIGLSVDPVENSRGNGLPGHRGNAGPRRHLPDDRRYRPQGGDPAYDMLPEGAEDHIQEGRTAADNATVRSVFVIGPDKKIKAMLTYPMTTGRNFDEVLRLLDSCQLTAEHTVATPVNWKPGDDVIIPPAVSNEQAAAKYPNGWKTLTPYLRVVAQPRN